jgi:hypothetical protein
VIEATKLLFEIKRCSSLNVFPDLAANGEDPFKRASNFASLGYQSLDSDLLPKEGEDNV